MFDLTEEVEFYQVFYGLVNMDQGDLTAEYADV